MSKKSLDWEDLKVLAGYRDTYHKWLKPKLDWLAEKNPDYYERISEGAKVPYKWSFDVWYPEELKREQEYFKKLSEEDDAIF
jgi:hypothetical protein